MLRAFVQVGMSQGGGKGGSRHTPAGVNRRIAAAEGPGSPRGKKNNPMQHEAASGFVMGGEVGR